MIVLYIEQFSPANRHSELIEKLVDIWHKSVCATHLFLTDSDINEIKTQVYEGLKIVPILLVVYDNKNPIGFAGIDADERKLEMLFILPAYFKQAIGYKLISTAIDDYKVTYVDVNEQNPSALKFYQRQGFSVFNRLATDDMNRPFPILQLILN